MTVPIPTLTPAYGRDYKSIASVTADFLAGKDFIYNDISSPYDNKPCNYQDLKASGISTVKLRYARLTKVTIAKVT